MSGNVAAPRIIVVGGGITGLAAAHRLVEISAASDAPISILILEAGDRPGGQIRTERDGEFLFEGGPDALVAQKVAGVALCERIGLGAELQDLSAGRAGTQILREGRLVRVPDGFLMMAPTRLLPLLASPLFTLAGKLRMAIEPLVPRRPPARDDESLASFVARRFGREALDRVAEPVMASLYTADADRLSLRMSMPRFLDLEAVEGSVTRGLRRAARSSRLRPFGHGTGRGGFVALEGGLVRIVEAVTSRLPHGCVRSASPVGVVRRLRATGTWSVRLEDSTTFEADAVVLACPAYAAAHLLREQDAPLGSDLLSLKYSSCATVNVVYRSADVGARLDSFGFFVPRTERLPILACSYVSEKFKGRAPVGSSVFRAFFGGVHHPEAVDASDDELIRRTHDLLRAVLSIRGEPTRARIHRFPRAMPQFDVGSRTWVEWIQNRAAEHPGLFLAGAVEGAIGLPDCIRSGEGVAERAVAFLSENQHARDVRSIAPRSSARVAYHANQNA